MARTAIEALVRQFSTLSRGHQVSHAAAACPLALPSPLLPVTSVYALAQPLSHCACDHSSLTSTASLRANASVRMNVVMHCTETGCLPCAHCTSPPKRM